VNFSMGLFLSAHPVYNISTTAEGRRVGRPTGASAWLDMDVRRARKPFLTAEMAESRCVPCDR